jgi:hypothetical protein
VESLPRAKGQRTKTDMYADVAKALKVQDARVALLPIVAEFRERMIGQRAGSVSVTDVRYEYLINEDAEEYLNAVLVLSDPPANLDDWPIDAIARLQMRSEAVLRELGIAPPYFVATRFNPEPDELDEGSDE